LIAALTSGDTQDLSTDAGRLRRETLAMIRSALRIDASA
jgi:hypothetical protein